MEAAATHEEPLTIGALARRAGVRPSTLRYYESVGILPSPPRVGGQRRYDGSAIDTLDLVRLAKDAGFTIAEIRQLLRGFERTTPASARWRVLAEKKRETLATRIERALQMQRMLDALLACQCVELADCPSRCGPARDEGAAITPQRRKTSARHSRASILRNATNR